MIPLSDITIKYTSGGLLQYQNKGTRESYKGYYMETITGEYYAGVNNIKQGRTLILKEGDLNKNPNPSRNVRKWNILKKNTKKFLEGTTPIPTMKPYPTEGDYNQGFFTRYFSKRVNDSLYQEIEKKVYKNFLKEMICKNLLI